MPTLRRLFHDPLLRHNAVFFAGSMLVAAINYLYYPVLGRLLSVGEFGEVTALFAFTSQIGVVLGVFSFVAIHLASNSGIAIKRNVLDDVYAIVFWLQIAIIAVFVFAAPFIANALQFASVIPLFFLAFNTYVALPYGLLTSALQGKKEFTKISIGSLISVAGKLLFSVLFVFLGAGVLGAIGGLVAAQLVALFYFSRFSLMDLQFLPKVRPVFDRVLTCELYYALLVFVATGTIALFSTADTILVKYFFPPDMAGEYAGISVVARILYFATGSIAAVLLPSITLLHSRAESLRILGKSVLLVLGIGGVGLSLMCLYPGTIIALLIGEKFLPFAHLLPKVALMMFLAALINLFFIYFLALRNFILIPVALCGILLLSVFVYMDHSDIVSIISYFLFVETGVLVALLLYLAYGHSTHEQKTSFDHHPAL